VKSVQRGKMCMVDLSSQYWMARRTVVSENMFPLISFLDEYEENYCVGQNDCYVCAIGGWRTLHIVL